MSIPPENPPSPPPPPPPPPPPRRRHQRRNAVLNVNLEIQPNIGETQERGERAEGEEA